MTTTAPTSHPFRPTAPQHGRDPRPAAWRRGGLLAKTALAVVALAIAGGVTVAMMGGRDDADAHGEGGGTLEQYIVAKTSFDITTTANGELEAKNQIEIRNQLEQQATITYIIDEGKIVRKGELLIKLNDDAIKTNINEELLQVETAKAMLTQAEEAYNIQVSENESNLRKAQLKVELAKLALEQWEKGEVKSKRQELELAREKAKREYERLKEKYEQSKQLQDRGFLSKDELQRDELAFVEAEAMVARTTLDCEVYEQYQYPTEQKQKTSDLEEAEAELARVVSKNESDLATKKAELENRRRQLAIREEKLAKLEAQLAACTMVAPADGLVVYSTSMERGWGWGGEGPLQIGRQVYPNQLLIVLPDTSEMVASVKVHESLAGRIRPGLPATVKIEALGGHVFDGTVTSIGVLAENVSRWMDPNLREYTVKIALQDAAGAGLKPSMRCEGEIRLGRVEDAISVPLQAIFNEGFLRYVYIPSGSKYIRRPISIGRRSDRFAEITAGLEIGERVLLREPSPGEVLSRKWTDAELAAVGLRQTEQGKIEPLAPTGGPGGPGAPGGAARSRRPAEQIAASDTTAEPPKEVAAKPEEPATTETLAAPDSAESAKPEAQPVAVPAG